MTAALVALAACSSLAGPRSGISRRTGEGYAGSTGTQSESRKITKLTAHGVKIANLSAPSHQSRYQPGRSRGWAAAGDAAVVT